VQGHAKSNQFTSARLQVPRDALRSSVLAIRRLSGSGDAWRGLLIRSLDEHSVASCRRAQPGFVKQDFALPGDSKSSRRYQPHLFRGRADVALKDSRRRTCVLLS